MTIAFRLAGLVALTTLCAVYPLLPGEHDGLAVAVSRMAQACTLVALLFVPIGGLWIAHRSRIRASQPGGPAPPRHDRYYARAAAMVCIVMTLTAGGVAWGNVGLTLAVGTLAILAYMCSKWTTILGALPRSHAAPDSSTLLALTVVPPLALLVQVLVVGAMTDVSRARAIAGSAQLIGDIEGYRAAHGRYPASLQGVWPDYKTGVKGIAQFHYTPHADAYSLFFEQPLPLLHAPGTREFVVYNPLGQHLMLSHAAWNLTRPPAVLSERQGWYAVAETSAPGWRRFLFD